MKKKSYDPKTIRALDLWVKLARCYAVVAQKSAENIRQSGLTPPQFAVIECLGHLGTLSLGKICEKVLVSGGNMTVVVDNLTKSGLVRRIACPTDRRSHYVELTEKGQKLFQRIFPAHAATIVSAVSGLNAAEQTQLARLLKKLGLSVR